VRPETAADSNGPFESLEQPSEACPDILAFVEQLPGIGNVSHLDSELAHVEGSRYGERIKGRVEFGRGQLHLAKGLADEGQ